jgi:hypothetical protein
VGVGENENLQSCGHCLMFADRRCKGCGGMRSLLSTPTLEIVSTFFVSPVRLGA